MVFSPANNFLNNTVSLTGFYQFCKAYFQIWENIVSIAKKVYRKTQERGGSVALPGANVTVVFLNVLGLNGWYFCLSMDDGAQAGMPGVQFLAARHRNALHFEWQWSSFNFGRLSGAALL